MSKEFCIYQAYYKYKSCIIPKLLPPLIVTYSHIHSNHILEDFTLLSSSISNYLTFYIENHIDKLEKWRNEEANYEEKEEPPDWNFQIHNPRKFLSIQVILASSFLSKYLVISLLLETLGIYLAQDRLQVICDLMITLL